MSSSEKKHTIKYFSVWRLQNRLTLFSLMAILVLSALIAAESALLPRVGTTEFIAFIVLIPTFACFGIATCHSSNLESEKARHEYQKLSSLFSEAEGSQITLDRFFSISSDLMAVAGKNGYLKKVSKSLVDTLGYSEETLLNTPFVEFIHPDDREITHKHIEWLNLGVRSVGFENRYRAANGTYRTLSWGAAADSELGVRFASARDITEERSFKTYVQQILDSSPFLFVVQDLEGTITGCNVVFARALGVSQESLLGQKIKSLSTSELVTSFLEKESIVLKSQRPYTHEDGEYLSTLFPILDQDGKVVSVGKISLSVEKYLGQT